MPSYETEKPPGYYRELKRKRDEYQAKLVSKGIVMGSSKMSELMWRKFR